jgi:CBS domain-containing protein
MKGKSKMKRSSFFPFYFCLLYLTRTSVLTFLSSMYIIPSPAIVAADLPLPDALALLSQTEEGCILVTEEEQLKGILTEKDVVRAIASGIAISRSAIADVMMREVMSLTRSEAEDILFANNRRSRQSIGFDYSK